ncbi:MAG: ATP-binding protein [Thermoprotei archaeon]|nr:MAG: ATP-binding protein [Thermoprotei archaeon]RLF20610.1 MAG: ATP-binding protein [Thermoprotei archaeon]
MDPRLSIIPERLRHIDKKIMVVSGKGGVGKTVISSLMALELALMEKRVGLFDLDFNGPSCHIVLGVPEHIMPVEEKGLIPPTFRKVKFMSIRYFAKERPLPLRGEDAVNAIIELLSITRWGKLDYLILDLPPGTSDEVLDIIRLIKDVYALIITTPSKLALETVSRLIQLLKILKVPILGIIENMRRGESKVYDFAKKMDVRYLGALPYDDTLEEALGDVNLLLETKVAKALINIIRSGIIENNGDEQ